MIADDEKLANWYIQKHIIINTNVLTKLKSNKKNCKPSDTTCDDYYKITNYAN